MASPDDEATGSSRSPIDPPTTDEVFAALRTVIDPELHVDIVSLGMVPDVSIDGGTVSVSVKLCRLQDTLIHSQ